jgi:hypothetical protein
MLIGSILQMLEVTTAKQVHGMYNALHTTKTLQPDSSWAFAHS